eukprot:gene8012-16410_t
MQEAVFMNISTSKAVEYAIVESPLQQSHPYSSECEDYFDEDPVQKLNMANSEEETTDGKSSVFGASFNFVNSIVGAGIIGIPFAIKQCGFFSGIGLLLLVAYLVLNSVLFLIKAGIKEKKLHLEDLSEHLLGPAGFYAAAISMFLFAYGAMVAYMVIIGDTVPSILFHIYDGNSAIERDLVMLVTAVSIILPLCLYKDMSSLVWTSLLSVICDAAMVLVVLIASPRVAKSQGIQLSQTDYSIINPNLFIGLGTMSFAFVCQHQCFIVFRSLKFPNYRNWSCVARSSICFSLLMCMVFGLAGYLSFGSYSVGDILNNFPQKDRDVTVARALLAITMLFTYPMESFVARHCLMNILQRLANRCPPDDETNTSPTPVETDGEGNLNINMNINLNISLEIQSLPRYVRCIQWFMKIDSTKRIQRVVITLLLWSSSVGIAIMFGDLGAVLSLTGAVAASVLGYILPACIYFKSNESELAVVLIAIKSRFLNGQEEASFNCITGPIFYICNTIYKLRKFHLAGFMFIFGILALVVGVLSVVIDISS